MKPAAPLLAAILLWICASGCSGGAAGEAGYRNGATATPGGPTGWGSSGGELLGDMQNPWWVKNTAEIRYCILIDEDGISVSRGAVEELTDRAMAYWKQEYSRELSGFGTSAELNALFAMAGIGRQRQVKIACDGTEDLRIQFGYGTLSAEQKAFLPNPRRYMGVAVRTQYDPATMHGKGFILIASDRGPQALQRDDLISEPWRFRPVLFQVLLHEIGHVYGVPHIGPTFNFMSEQFAETILDKKLEPYLPLLTLDDTTSFFFPPASAQMCTDTWKDAKVVRKFFGLPDSINCLRFDQDAEHSMITVAAGARFGGPYYAIGAMAVSDAEAVPVPIVLLRFPDGQKVFTQGEAAVLGWSGGAFFTAFAISAQFYGPGSALPKPLRLEIGPGLITAVGESGGRIVQFLNGMPNVRLPELLDH